MTMHTLLVEILEENKMPPLLVRKVLEKYLATLNQYMESTDIPKKEFEFLISKDIIGTIQAFIHLVDYATVLNRNKEH